MKTVVTRDWDDAFANMAHVPNSSILPERWTERAQAYRNSGVQVEEIAYANHPRERLDIIWPAESPKGLAVFVHGGYWMRLDKSYWTDLAQGACSHGWAVCIPSYILAPEASISDMTQQIGRAITVAAEKIAGPIRLAGHSAGGHLVSRMLCNDTPLSAEIQERIQHCLSISGIHDLRPLLNTAMNDTLQLNMDEAIAQSPALHRPSGNSVLTAWVGSNERPEFIRQTKLLTLMWDGLDADTRCVVDEGHNHFTIIDGLRLQDSAITKAFVVD